MIQFKLNDKPVQVCSSWDDLTYNQFYGTMQPLDLRAMVTLFVTPSPDPTAQIAGNIDALIAALNFIKKPAVWDKPVLQCGPYKLPINHKGQYNIQFESLAQFEDMRAAMNKITGTGTVERTKSIAGLYPEFLAIYLQKIRDGDYSYNKAIAMIPEIRKYPAREVVTLGSFFLVKLTNLLNGTPDSSPTTTPNPKKRKRVTAGFKKLSGRSPRSRK